MAMGPGVLRASAGDTAVMCSPTFPAFPLTTCQYHVCPLHAHFRCECECSFGVRYKETPRGPANPMLTPGPNP
jgi:hypothetical protein